MKNFKRGFTLAELLMCVAIIAIVSAMGATITKKTTEKAYNGYFYTGYTTLANTIAEISKNNPNIYNISIFAKEINRVINNIDNTPQGNKVTASNGISYTMYPADESHGLFQILMTVPQAKTRKNPNGVAYAMLVYDRNSGYLVPRNDIGWAVALGERPDLLPMYFDDGRRNSRPVANSYANVFCRATNNKSLVAPISMKSILSPDKNNTNTNTNTNSTTTNTNSSTNPYFTFLQDTPATNQFAIIDCSNASVYRYNGPSSNGIIRIGKPGMPINKTNNNIPGQNPGVNQNNGADEPIGNGDINDPILPVDPGRNPKEPNADKPINPNLQEHDPYYNESDPGPYVLPD